MIKNLLWDLDGVIIETKKLHFESLNQALGQEYAISWNDHLNRYDGLKTNQKLDMLSKEKGFPLDNHKKVWKLKQELTLQQLKNIKPSNHLINIFSKLEKDGYKIACCSNSIRKTVLTTLSKLGIIEFFDLIISNEDVQLSKPHPSMYWQAMSTLGCLPEETLILEDSPYGLLAANRSGANILRITCPEELNYELIKKATMNNKITSPKWVNKKMNVLIPMAGGGTRFEKAGFTFPKPLIEVRGEPMIKVVIDNLNIDANYIYIVQKKHREKYNLDTLLNLITPNCKIVETDGITAGAACSALLAKEYINNDNPLFFANSDQFVSWNSNDFFYKMQESNVDGGIVTFTTTHPKYSFVKIDEHDNAVQVAEKNPISDNGTVGFYWWKNGKDFIKYAEQMINKNLRTNNEFYVCPVFAEAIQDKKIIKTFPADKMFSLGTPEDLDFFLKNYEGNI